MSPVPSHLQKLYGSLVSIPVKAAPKPWRPLATHPIGGLVAVGFPDGLDLVLVASSSGKGLFDCASGSRISRHQSEDDGIDPNLMTSGIGDIENPRVRMAGTCGGGLPLRTTDGWTLDVQTLSWPDQSVFLLLPGHWLFGPAFNKPGDPTKIACDSELRACGFSPSGRSIVIATSSEICIYRRDA
jgi:hypothetical protein